MDEDRDAAIPDAPSPDTQWPARRVSPAGCRASN